MHQDHDDTRRMLLTVLAGAALTSVTLPAGAATPVNHQHHSRILVIFFFRSGNTRVLAGVIHRTLNTDLFEIEPAMPYPEDYFQTVAQASRERENANNPPLKSHVTGMEHYQTVYLGFPVWGTTVPPVVRTFLSTHNLKEKQLIPFITHGGYGVGDSKEVLARLAPDARREKPLVMECDQERRTTETVSNWLETLRG